MDLSQFKIDQDAADGKWFEYAGAKFKIAYFSRPEFNRVSAKIGKRYPKEALKADPALVQTMTIEIMAEAVLLDWQGVKNEGKELEPTKANKILVLGIQPVRDWVSEIAQDLANFTVEAEAEDAAALKSGD